MFFKVNEGAIRALIAKKNIVKLIQILNDEGHSNSIYIAIIKGLGEIGQASELPILVKILWNKDEELSRAAAGALEQLGWKPNNEKNRIHYCIVKKDYDACVKYGAKAVDQLLLDLKNQEKQNNEGAILALGEIGDTKAIPYLMELLSDSNKKISAAAAKALMQIGTDEANRAVSEYQYNTTVDLLETGDKAARENAVIALVQKGGPEVFAPLVAAMNDEDKNVSKAAMSGLRELGTPEALQAIKEYKVKKHIKLLGAKEMKIKIKAAEALANIGDPLAVKPLIECLAFDNDSLNKIILKGIKYIGKVAISDLIDALESDNKNIKISAAKLLGTIGDTTAVDALLSVLEDPDEEIRNSIIQILSELGSPLAKQAIKDLETRTNIKALDHKNMFVRRKAAKALISEVDENSIELFIKILGDDDEIIRSSAEKAFKQLGDSAVFYLVSILDEKNKNARLSAIKLIGDLKDPSAIEPLVKVLYDDDKDVSRVAIEALQKIGTSSAILAIREYIINEQISLLGNKDSFTRKKAAESLINVGDLRVVNPLIKVLGDKDDNVRKAAATAIESIGIQVLDLLVEPLEESKNSHIRNELVKIIGNIGGANGVGPIISVLNDVDLNVRKTALEILNKIGTPEAVEAIIQHKVNKNIAVLEDENKNVRRVAVQALGEIGGRRVVPALTSALKDKMWEVRKAAIEALEKVGTPAVDTLISVIGSGSTNVRTAAIDALKRINNPAAVPALIKILEDEEVEIYQATSEALVSFGGASIIPMISVLRTSEDWNVRKNIVKIMGEIGEQDAVEAIVEVLKNDTFSVRVTAAEALGKIRDPRSLKPLVEAIQDEDEDVRKAASDALRKFQTKQIVASR